MAHWPFTLKRFKKSNIGCLGRFGSCLGQFLNTIYPHCKLHCNLLHYKNIYSFTLSYCNPKKVMSITTCILLCYFNFPSLSKPHSFTYVTKLSSCMHDLREMLILRFTMFKIIIYSWNLFLHLVMLLHLDKRTIRYHLFLYYDPHICMYFLNIRMAELHFMNLPSIAVHLAWKPLLQKWMTGTWRWVNDPMVYTLMHIVHLISSVFVMNYSVALIFHPRSDCSAKNVLMMEQYICIQQYPSPCSLNVLAIGAKNVVCYGIILHQINCLLATHTWAI